MWRTAFGLQLRSCGESPAAAESLGVNVYRYKFIIRASGALADLSSSPHPRRLEPLPRRSDDGRGYIGLAAMIFGNWRPGGLLAGSALFGYRRDPSARRAERPPILLLVAVLMLLVGLWQMRKGRVVQGVASLVFAGLTAWWYAATDAVRANSPARCRM